MDNSIIKVENLTKFYLGLPQPAIDHLVFSIEKGEVFGLLGPNGAGKTTTISILCGYMKATSGNIWIDGLSFKGNKESVKKIIGVVPQNIALFPSLTARENLQFYGNMYGLKGKLLKGKIDQYLEIFGLGNNGHRQVETYSGGMKRRVNLIAGILHSPKILFLDEPTVGIDVQSRNVILEFLESLKDSGTTIIYTSHYLEEAERICTRVSIIDDGKIIAQGSPRSLIDKNQGCSNLEQFFLHLTGKDLRD